MLAFSVFAASEILYTSFKSKKNEIIYIIKEKKIEKKKRKKKKEKKRKWYEMGNERKEEPQLMAYIPPT